MKPFGSLAARLSLAVVLLLLAFGLLVAIISRNALSAHEDEALQRLSHGLAAHIVSNWPDITLTDPDAAEKRAREELLTMLSSVNPGIQVYVLDADGRVDAYIGEPGMVRQFQVDLAPIRDFLEGAELPLRGTDPMGSDRPRLFSAAMFPAKPNDTQLFELAALEASTEVVRSERFLLDELVTDAVQKFEGIGQPTTVHLAGTPPGPVAVDGDLELIERAITNLIDNAMRHGGDAPVLVSLRREGATAEIVVEDGGPGLRSELGRRLEQGDPVRDPALRRPGGGIGGLGLAIAQRIAVLHGGALKPLHAPDGGTKLCLALPLAA